MQLYAMSLSIFHFFLRRDVASAQGMKTKKKRLPMIETRTEWRIFLTNETPISVHAGFDAG